MTLERDYFDGYRASAPHPYMTSTGSEGRCDICGSYAGNREHDEPWTRVVPEFEEVPEPEVTLGEPEDPYAAVVFGEGPGIPIN